MNVLSFVVSLCLCSGLPANIQLDIDGDRETERIYSLFSTYMSKLIKMQGVYHSVLSTLSSVV